MGAGVQRPDQAGRGPVPRALRRGGHAAAVPRRADRALHRRAGALRAGAGLRGLQPQPGPERRALDVGAADRRGLVPVLREASRAGRAGHGARVGQQQPQLPRHRRALPERGHHGVHADGPGRPVRAVPRAAAGDPARRRGGALPLGPVPGAGRHAGAAAAGPARHGQRVLRHLRLPPAGHRPAAGGDRREEHPVRLGDDRGGARHRPGDRLLLRRHEAVCRCGARCQPGNER